MPVAPEPLHLVEQAPAGLRVHLATRGEELQGHALAELEIVGAVDLAHRAAAEHADHPVTAGEHLTRAEAAGVVGARCRAIFVRTGSGLSG